MSAAPRHSPRMPALSVCLRSGGLQAGVLRASNSRATSLGNFVDRRNILRTQLPSDRLGILLHLLRLRRPGDNARNHRIRSQPAECQLEQRVSALRAEILQQLNLAPIRFVKITIGEAF